MFWLYNDYIVLDVGFVSLFYTAATMMTIHAFEYECLLQFTPMHASMCQL